ncbi:response regulator transcription factor [Yersinia ruckeri]|uniref:response regulator transcription factor n=1 Tax=Yersinia ruckeri TaxID=29486 RepID=UPI0020BE93F9|nr:response regulator transcription factor [Yersinia ruckeri]EKN4182891.1 response regulator transcription factor [Yersinia ruckeri]MCK8555746.1 response regulator transcription factor [Yersinia ruckeri]
MPTPSKLNIIVAEDESLSRVALKAILENYPFDNRDITRPLIYSDFTLDVVGSTEHAAGLIKLLKDHKVDLLLLDYALAPSPEAFQQPNIPLDGITLLKRILKIQPDLKVIVHTAHNNLSVARIVYQAGAHAFVNKSGNILELFFAITHAAQGKKYFPADLMGNLSTGKNDSVNNLSERETEVLRLLLSGLDQKNIGHQLNISFKTVSNTKIRAFKKLGITSNADFFKYANEIDL